jgi:hypothetical protein
MAVVRNAIYPPPRPEFPHLVVMMVGSHTRLVEAAKNKAEVTTIYEAALLRRERFDAARMDRLARPRKGKRVVSDARGSYRIR